MDQHFLVKALDVRCWLHTQLDVQDVPETLVGLQGLGPPVALAERTGDHGLPTADDEVEILARIKANLTAAPLAGFVCEGMSPFAMADPTRNAALSVAISAGMPVVRVGRGNTGRMAYRTDPTFISGNNLTATKARILLMAALLKLGALPPAKDPFHPTFDERAATEQAVARYQTLFDLH